MTGFKMTQELSQNKARQELISVLLLCAKEEFQRGYLCSNPWSQMPEDLLFLWQNEYPPEDGSLEKEFSQEEREELSSLESLLKALYEKRERGEGKAWDSFWDEDFLGFQREAKRALLVFPKAEIESCYDFMKEKLGV